MLKVRQLEQALIDGDIEYEIRCDLNLETLKRQLEEFGYDSEKGDMIDELQGAIRVRDVSLETEERENIFGNKKFNQKIVIHC